MYSDDKKNTFERFSREMDGLGGKAFPALKEQVAETVAQIIAEEQAGSVIGCASAYLKSLELEKTLGSVSQIPVSWLPSARPEKFDEAAYRRQLASADLAITSADYLIAQTGTAVFLSQNHPSRLITLLPPSVIVIAALDSLYPDLTAFHAMLQKTGLDRDSSIIYFSGPSRTADIEKNLVLGVHGPKRLSVIVARGEE